MVVDPWMRKLDRREFIQLALTSNAIVEVAYTGLSALTFGINTKDWTLQRRSNSYAADDGLFVLGGLFNDEHKVDNVLDGETRQHPLKTDTMSRGRLKKIIR